MVLCAEIAVANEVAFTIRLDPTDLLHPDVARLINRIEQSGIAPREYDNAEHLGRLISADVANLVGMQEDAHDLPGDSNLPPDPPSSRRGPGVHPPTGR